METAGFLVFALFGGLIFGGVSALIGGSRGVNGWGCFFLGLFFGPIGLLYAVLAPSPYAAQAAVPASAEDAQVRGQVTPRQNELADALAKLADLRDRGALTDAEFASAKSALLK